MIKEWLKSFSAKQGLAVTTLQIELVRVKMTARFPTNSTSDDLVLTLKRQPL
jgi:hypothetical protein